MIDALQAAEKALYEAISELTPDDAKIATLTAERDRLKAIDNGQPAEEPPELMSFSQALDMVQLGEKIARVGWNGKGMWIELQTPDTHSKMSLPYLFLNYPGDASAPLSGARVPWLASQTDLLSDDWMIVE